MPNQTSTLKMNIERREQQNIVFTGNKIGGTESGNAIADGVSMQFTNQLPEA